MDSRKRGVDLRLPFFFSRAARSPFFLLLIFGVLCFASYANTLPNPFIFDDIGLVVANPAVKSSPLTGDFLRKDLYSASFLGSNFYRPLQALSFMVDFRLWGMRPAGYHFTNICVQALVSFLVYLFLLALLRDRFIAAAGSLLFCVSPLHTEAVAYVSGRADPLMAVWVLSSFLLFLKAQSAHRGRGLYLVCSLVAFICALLSKELGIVFPLVIVAWSYYYRRLKERWYVTRNIVPFFVIAAVYALLRSSVLRFSPLLVPDLYQYPLWLRLAVFPQVLWSYCKIIALPVDLHMSWTLMRPLAGFEVALSLAGTFAALFLAAYMIISRRAVPAVSFLFAWALVFFLPQSGLYPINAFVAEHFIYLPSIAVFAGIAWLARRFLRRSLAYVCVAGLVMASCVLTAARNYEWRDPVVFYSRILELSPYSFTARVNLGVEYLNRKKFDLAEEQLKRAVEIKPNRVEGYSNLASLYYQAGRWAESEEQYRIVERMVPYSKAGEVQNNIGLLLLDMGRFEEALARLELAGRLDPSLSYPHYNRAHVLVKQGRNQEALEEIIHSYPAGLLRHDDKKGFLDAFRHSLEVEDLKSPGTFYNNLGVRLLVAGFEDWGYASLQKALDIMPDYADVHCNVGFYYLTKGDARQARVSFKRALASDPAHAKAAALLEVSQ